MNRKAIFSLLVISGIFIYAKNLPSKGEVKEASESKEAVTLTQVLTPTSASTPTPTPKPTTMPKPTATPTSAPKSELNILDFFYPGATQVSSTSDTLTVESPDDPDRITEWYKNKINSLGMSAKSYVVTKTNGSVLNKLVADNGEGEIRVEITKSKKQDKTEIVVTVHSS